MLHRHVEALFQERSFHINIASRSNLLLGGSRMIEGVNSLRLKPPLARVEDYGRLHIFVSRLVERLRTRATLLGEFSVRILTWAWLINFQ